MKKILPILILVFTLSLSMQTIEAQTPYSIMEVRATNADGTLIHDGETVEITGNSIGPNFRPDGLTFVLFDEAGNIGITIFTVDDPLGYTVISGDNLTIIGEVTQYNGLAEVVPTSITINSQGNGVPAPQVVTTLNEESESKLVKFKDATLVDPSTWMTSGSFNVDFTDGTETIQVRIDSDTNIAGEPAPTGAVDITGIGGQFDFDAPYEEGYQMFPRSTSDIVPAGTASTDNVYKGNIELFPNPTDNLVNLKADDEILNVEVFALNGQKLFEQANGNAFSVTTFENGLYLVKATLAEGVWQSTISVNH